jgi:hypothetical protein
MGQQWFKMSIRNGPHQWLEYKQVRPRTVLAGAATESFPVHGVINFVADFGKVD